MSTISRGNELELKQAEIQSMHGRKNPAGKKGS